MQQQQQPTSSLSPASVLQALDLAGGADGINEGVLFGEQSGVNDRKILSSICPSTGETLGRVSVAHETEIDSLIASAHSAYIVLRMMPAPERGTVLLTIRSLLAENKVSLGALISLEMGKAISEGMGEIQEAIDICDYAIGLSPMLPGKVVPSERRDHFLMESPSPLGVVLVVSAFNFPHAVMFWNFALSFVCGNATVWKPSETAGLIAVATTKLVHKAFRQHKLPVALLSLCCGEVSVSKALVAHPRIPLVSFTGSEKTGRLVSAAVGAKLGRSILELGGNNAIVVLPDANQEMALRTVLFGALGTAGQRCTSTRRLLLHQSIAEDFVERLSKAYANVINTHRIGDPLDQAYLMGPVHTAVAVDAYNAALVEAQKQGGRLLCGGSAVKHLKQGYEKGFWVQPAMVFHADRHPEIMEEETFAPILHISTFKTLEQAIDLNNRVRQGLSSSLFTTSMQSVFEWLGPAGSDTGICNVNQSTSGAEIGCGFGGNKATGWGRESGGDAWKQYCSWKSATVNFGNQLGLAQGLVFE